MSIRLQTDLHTYTAVGPPGCTVTELAEDVGLTLNTRCAGNGVCGGCAIKLGPGRYEIDGEPIEIFRHGYTTALGCQTVVCGTDAEITIPSTSVLEQEASIESDFKLTKQAAEPPAVREILLPTHDFPAGERDAWTWLLKRLETREDIVPTPPGPAALTAWAPVFAEPPETFRILLTRQLESWHLLAVQPGDTNRPVLGVAVDIGTTTVAARAIDLLSGDTLASASMYNQQIRKADDVGARISFGQTPDRVRELQRLVVNETLAPLLHTLCEELQTSPTDLLHIACSGNTVMTHLLFGWSPESIGRLPFLPMDLGPSPVRGADLHLPECPSALITAVPGISGYVGGDLTSGLYQSELAKSRGAELLIDIGTNGEIILNQEGHLTACATAAGPAFEGYGLANGCRAARGAVESVRIHDNLDVELGVIGHTTPNGICGSGIIDFVAQGFLCGLINHMGRYDRDRVEAAGRLLTDANLCGNSIGFVLAHPEKTGRNTPLFITEQDVSQVLKAKAAIYAGVFTLLAARNLRGEDLDRICLAGGFARHIHIRHAIVMGLLPDLPEDRFDLLGNTSLQGAISLLSRASASTAMDSLSRTPSVIELNVQPAFEGSFVDALAIPNMDPDLFPSVGALPA